MVFLPFHPPTEASQPSNSLSGPLKLTVSHLRQRFSGNVAGHIHIRTCPFPAMSIRTSRFCVTESVGETTRGHRHHSDDCKYSFRETCVQGLRSRWGEDSETVMPV